MEPNNKIVVFVNEFRKSVRRIALVLTATTIVVFFLAPQLLQVVQNHLADKLYFFSVAGPFLAHVKLALFCALFVLMPWFMTVLWKAMAKPFSMEGRQVFVFIFFTCLLFYSGTLFCYFITLPFGINFLLGYGSEELQPVISITKFVNFTTIFIFAFGVIFELPIFMVFLAKVKVCSRAFFVRSRRYAILFIGIVAALLTPTPDVVNMGLMGLPLYFLYEAGIIILKIMRIQ
ncbi:MAG: twin-arginine translocase subunit TatC [Desulfopila sp.]|jgi:sec-independent protein translocase protein TatC|nr:twin-arginine translocase subunit TatC [Desulfopila sp.]